jgi:hypothetical protein
MDIPNVAALVRPEMKELHLKPLFAFQIDVKPAYVIGATPWSDRRVGEITGGYFEGERLRGRFLSGGSDWQTVRNDGAWTLDVRLVMETDDKQLIGMTYRGIRHGPKDVLDAIARGEEVSPTSYYLRAVPFFETSSEKYGWLNRLISVAIGHRGAKGVIYQVFEVL